MGRLSSRSDVYLSLIKQSNRSTSAVLREERNTSVKVTRDKRQRRERCNRQKRQTQGGEETERKKEGDEKYLHLEGRGERVRENFSSFLLLGILFKFAVDRYNLYGKR
jgi:hypothetical protein